jgi:hypothetical protein
MKLIFISILFAALQCLEFNEASLFKLRNQVQEMPADSPGLDLEGQKGTKESRLYKKLDDFGKTKALLYVLFFAGGIALLRSSARLIRHADNLLLRVQHKPNSFDSFRFTGNPFILKNPFFAIYHMFLGRCAYLSYLVWPLKYTAAISFLATIAIRLFHEEALARPINLQSLLQSPLSVQLTLGIIMLLFLAVQVLLIIESIRKTRWFSPLRLLVFLVMQTVIFVLVFKLFWVVFSLGVLYLFTHLGKDYINRQKYAATNGYNTEERIYEPWPDGAEKIYPESSA